MKKTDIQEREKWKMFKNNGENTQPFKEII